MGEKTVLEVNFKLRDKADMFIKKKQRETSELKQDISQGDYPGVKMAGSSIHKNAERFGFAKIQEFGQAIESAAGLKDSGKLKEIIAEYSQYLNSIELVGVE